MVALALAPPPCVCGEVRLTNRPNLTPPQVITPLMATATADAYDNFTDPDDPIGCAQCAEAWGWSCCFSTPAGRVPIERFGCCNKRAPR